MRVLVVNAGSSSLKLSVVDEDDALLMSENLPSPRGSVDEDERPRRDRTGRRIDAVGHRIVHGGTEFVDPVLIDATVVRRLQALSRSRAAASAEVAARRSRP